MHAILLRKGLDMSNQADAVIILREDLERKMALQLMQEERQSVDDERDHDRAAWRRKGTTKDNQGSTCTENPYVVAVGLI